MAILLAMLLLTLRGSPSVYYGEEIGMRTLLPARLEDVQDPVGRTFWPTYKGCDCVRCPMQGMAPPELDSRAGRRGSTWRRKQGRGTLCVNSLIIIGAESYRAILRFRRSSDALCAGFTAR